MGQVVQRSVFVRNTDTGEQGWLHEGDEVPDWADGYIQNEKVFEPRPEIFVSADGKNFTLGDALKQKMSPEALAATEDSPNQQAEFEAMTKEDLQDLLRERDLPVSGTKDELIERLRGNDSANG